MADAGLPEWANWTQAIVIPVVGVIIATASVYIARQQKRLADIKLQNELYDRRYKIYLSARNYLIKITSEGNVTLEEFFEFRRGTSDSVFLLSQDIVDYLEKIGDKARELRGYQQQLKNENLTQDRRVILADKAGDCEEWFGKQFDVLIEKFRPAMRLDKHALK
jgi:hypothetical protein